MKRYVLFAGVNGAGKTTLYQTNAVIQELPRINLDEIVREIGSWKCAGDVALAGHKAVDLIKEYFEKGISFNQETTLCGKSILRNIKKAKELNYRVEVYFVGLDSPDLAKARVLQRVKDGGHGIPDSDIERRYFESLENLASIMKDCDFVQLYDNSEKFHHIATFEYGICMYRDTVLPSWCEKLFVEV